MSYNGIGLSTARGSGTNGHIQRNMSTLRPRDRFDDRDAAKDYTHRAPDPAILEHERRRRVEVKCLELQVSLEDDGVGEDEVVRQVQVLRERLLNESAGKAGTDRERGSIKPHERHELGQAKALSNEKFRMALGISKDHVEGIAFDQEAQARLKVERQQRREEQHQIRLQLEADRARALEKRQADDRARREAQELERQARGRAAPPPPPSPPLRVFPAALRLASTAPPRLAPAAPPRVTPTAPPPGIAPTAPPRCVAPASAVAHAADAPSSPLAVAVAPARPVPHAVPLAQSVAPAAPEPEPESRPRSLALSLSLSVDVHVHVGLVEEP